MLKKIPHQYIYEPWNAPRSVQEKAGCIIGQDYPRPIVNHADVSKRNINRMKEARACHYGEKPASGRYYNFAIFKEIYGGICCGGHHGVTYGEELLYLRIFYG